DRGSHEGQHRGDGEDHERDGDEPRKGRPYWLPLDLSAGAGRLCHVPGGYRHLPDSGGPHVPARGLGGSTISSADGRPSVPTRTEAEALRRRATGLWQAWLPLG